MPSTSFEFKLKDDFNQVYNLPDPRPYYAGLKPSDYRMPGVIAKAIAALSVRRHPGRTLKVLDFACGFGAIGACLRRGLRMRELYDYYGAVEWSHTEPTRLHRQDADWYAHRDHQSANVELIGVDVAPHAVAYAEAMGLVDQGLVLDLTSGDSAVDHADLLAGVDLVVESGGVGRIQHLAFGALLASGARPWFLMSPRPDVDWTALNSVWDTYGYHAEVIAQTRYRRTLGVDETQDVSRRAAALGLSEAQTFRQGYIAVPLTLVRPSTAEPDRALRDWFDADELDRD